MTICKICGKPVYFGSLYHPSCVEREAGRSIPQNVKVKEGANNSKHYYCPKCGRQQKAPGVRKIRNGSYCERCGQHLKWREAE